jgi:hypothetical protein
MEDDEDSAASNALSALIKALTPLDEEQRQRVLMAASAFFNIGMSTLNQNHTVSYSTPDSRHTRPSFSSSPIVSPKEFLLSKQPRTDVERIACLAFYLTHFRDIPYFKTLDLAKLNTEIVEIDRSLKAIFEEQPVELIEGPSARTWDDEYRALFKSFDIETQNSETMYTSVHYVVASKSSTTVTCEIQVRTLMEEVWGEVDHKVNYPHPNEHVACTEQVRALARATSSATRLVDSIFATVADFATKVDVKPPR